jgi:hypothetical protein
MGFDWGQFTGPLGGVIALSFGSGCAATWAFAMFRVREIRADLGGRIDDLRKTVVNQELDCQRRISTLEQQVAEFNRFMISGMRDQLAQVRLSSARIFHPNDDVDAYVEAIKKSGDDV